MDKQNDNANSSPTTEVETKALLAAYAEISKSFHAIDDFRTRLLGLLPLSSLVGVILLDTNTLMFSATASSGEILGFAAIFAFMLTLALFGYEIRGMRRSHQLINEGKHIEDQLGIQHGQFHICADEQCRDEQDSKALPKLFNSKLIACAIYSIVFAAWLFIFLRLGMSFDTYTCAISATIAGVVLTIIVYRSVNKLFPA